MVQPKQPFKYLVHYPFSPLTVAKVHNVILYTLSLVIWRAYNPTTGGFLLISIPVCDLLNIGTAIILLWFMVQKFYYRKVEISLCCAATILSFFSLFNVIFHWELQRVLVLTHFFCLLSWMFCIYWSYFMTSNTVSNLFIAEWGQATTDIEIEALEEHF